MNKGTVVLIISAVLFVAGLVLLGISGIGILLMLVGIGGLIVGSMMLMHISGRVNADYFDGRTQSCMDQPAEKVDIPPVSEQAAQNRE